jgi:hypothetical protein
MTDAVTQRRPGRDDEIVIVGAGPAGLSAAYFLKQHGYRNVTVMEKLSRVGGLCFTVTEDYTCFDLGANYLTPDYRETLRLAREFNIEMYAERNIVVAEIDPDRAGYKAVSPWAAARGATPTIRFILACLKYAWLRWRLGPIIDPPGHAGISRRPELCRPFLEWLHAHDLECLQAFFELPITVMGYGYIDEIPTPYALKYIGLRTFIAMCIKALPLTSWWPWPKRFCLGYQWLWQTVARELNVWLNIDIKAITRRDDGRCSIRYTHREQNLHDERSETDEFFFDHLILACPLSTDVLARFLTLSDEENALFCQIQTFAYCMTSLKVELPGLPSDYAMATIPLTRIGTPWAITKQADTSNFIQFYTRIDPSDLRDDEMTRTAALDEVYALIKRLGGDLDTIDDDAWHSFDRWPYFKHVDAAAFRAGFYDRVEGLQGRQHTYYLGGLLDFELVERILRYSRKLVTDRFPKV